MALELTEAQAEMVGWFAEGIYNARCISAHPLTWDESWEAAESGFRTWRAMCPEEAP